MNKNIKPNDMNKVLLAGFLSKLKEKTLGSLVDFVIDQEYKEIKELDYYKRLGLDKTDFVKMYREAIYDINIKAKEDEVLGKGYSYNNKATAAIWKTLFLAKLIDKHMKTNNYDKILNLVIEKINKSYEHKIKLDPMDILSLLEV